MTIVSAVHSFQKIQTSVWFHFLSPLRTSFNISCNVGMLAINSFSFSISHNVFICLFYFTALRYTSHIIQFTQGVHFNVFQYVTLIF